MIVAEDLVVKRGRIPNFYRDVECERPALLTEYRNHYTYSYVKGRRATAEDVPRILEVAARDIWRVPSACTVLLEQRAKDHLCNNISVIAQNHCPVTYRAVYEALDIIKNASLPLAECVHGRMLFENIIFQLDGQPVFVNPVDPCQVITPALDRGALLMSYVMRWEERGYDWPGVIDYAPWDKPREWPKWADVVDWSFLVSYFVRELPDYKSNPALLRGLALLGNIKPE